MSKLTFISHTEHLRSAVQLWCMSCMVKEDVVDTRTDTDRFSRSQTLAVSCNGEPDFPVEEFTSQSAVEFIQRGEHNSKIPVQTVRRTLNDNFARRRGWSAVTFRRFSGAATDAHTHTDSRTLAVWAFVCFWMCIKCVKGIFQHASSSLIRM